MSKKRNFFIRNSDETEFTLTEDDLTGDLDFCILNKPCTCYQQGYVVVE